MVSLLVFGCSASEISYKENIDLALEHIENNNLNKAQKFLMKALEDKPGDEIATTYHDQVPNIILAVETLAVGKLSEAKKYVEDIVIAKNGLDLLVDQAAILETEILKLENDRQDYKND